MRLMSELAEDSAVTLVLTVSTDITALGGASGRFVVMRQWRDSTAGVLCEVGEEALLRR
jgi:hypothetical protein